MSLPDPEPSMTDEDLENAEVVEIKPRVTSSRYSSNSSISSAHRAGMTANEQAIFHKSMGDLKNLLSASRNTLARKAKRDSIEEDLQHAGSSTETVLERQVAPPAELAERIGKYVIILEFLSKALFMFVTVFFS